MVRLVVTVCAPPVWLNVPAPMLPIVSELVVSSPPERLAVPLATATPPTEKLLLIDAVPPVWLYAPAPWRPTLTLKALRVAPLLIA